MSVRNCRECRYSEFCRKPDLSPNHLIHVPDEQRSSVCTSQDANNAIMMHFVCKDSVEHHRGILLNDKGQSVIECECKVLSYR